MVEFGKWLPLILNTLFDVPDVLRHDVRILLISLSDFLPWVVRHRALCQLRLRCNPKVIIHKHQQTDHILLQWLSLH